MTQEAFTFFWHGPFSQWHSSPFLLGGLRFTHAEQFMMYAKALLFWGQGGGRPDPGRPDAQGAEGPRPQGQRLRRSRLGPLPRGVVFDGSYAKFTQNPELREALPATRGTTLVEASPHDRVWGIGLAEDDPRAQDRAQWRGLNLLGEALTRVREALLWEQARASRRPA